MVLSICHQADLQVQSTKTINMHSNGPRIFLQFVQCRLLHYYLHVIPVSDKILKIMILKRSFFI